MPFFFLKEAGCARRLDRVDTDHSGVGVLWFSRKVPVVDTPVLHPDRERDCRDIPLDVYRGKLRQKQVARPAHADPGREPHISRRACFFKKGRRERSGNCCGLMTRAIINSPGLQSVLKAGKTRRPLNEAWRLPSTRGKTLR